MNPSVLHLGFSCLKRCVIFRKQKNCVSTKYKATVKGDKEMHGLQIRAIGVTQGDKTYTVQEWNKHVQDTFNK